MRRTVDDVLSTLSSPEGVTRLPAPPYSPRGGERRVRVGLCVPSMKNHTTDEGWQLFLGLEETGYHLWGHGIKIEDTVEGRPVKFAEGLVNVPDVLHYTDPTTLVLQDKREWEGRTAGRGFDPRETFRNVGVLREREEIFKLTVLKDAQHDAQYHRRSAEEIGAHGWVIYYQPRVVAKLAPYVRPEHLVRTYHTVDANLVRPYSANGRGWGLLSGALGGAYPLRTRIAKNPHLCPSVVPLPHPGYRRDGCRTPRYLDTLSGFKVAICTSSVYGYALRKLIEATACGCAVITDLPADEVLPEIDGNLHRVPSSTSPQDIDRLVRRLCADYDPHTQREYAERALSFYDYRAAGRRLADDVEALRRTYNA